MNYDSSLEPVLVTGAGGFVGGYLVRYLHHNGIPVRAMVRDKNRASDLAEIGIEVVEADLCNHASLETAVQGCKSVLHIAAIFRQAGLPDEDYYKANVEGTRALLDFSIKHGIKKFIHCSTVGVHSHIENPPGDENTPYKPADIYQTTKMEGEKVALEYFRSGKIQGSVIRPAMIYGPGDMRTLKLFKGISKHRFFYVGKGEVNVHFIDVRDLVRAFVLALYNTTSNGEVFIISGRESVSLKTLVTKISSMIGVSAPRIHVPVVPLQILGDICEAVCTPFKINPPIYRRRVDFFTKNRNFDSSKAERMLGFKPTLTLDQELREIIDWYAVHGYLSEPSTKLQYARIQKLIPEEYRPGHPYPAIKDPSHEQFQKLIQEDDSKNARTSVLMRYHDGTINFWNNGSENVYGWNRYEAEGRVSHHILQTQFPSQLDKINSQLLSDRIWKGNLLHTDRQGKEVEVESVWQVVDLAHSNKQLVIETNIPKAA